MAIFLTILKIIGIVLLSIIALVFLLLIIPLAFQVRRRDGVTSFYVRVIFIRLNIGKLQKLWKNKPPKEPELTDKEEKKPEKKKKLPKLDFDMIKAVASGASKGLKYLLKRIKLRKLSLRVIISGDAADVGMRTGEIWAAIGIISSLLSANLDTLYGDIEVIPDFDGSLDGQDKLSFNAQLHSCGLVLLAAGLTAFLNYRKLTDENNPEHTPKKKKSRTQMA